MVNQLVALHNGEPRISTFDIFWDLGYKEHRMMKKVVKDNILHFESMGLMQLELRKPKAKSKGGRPDESYLLTEDHFTLLIMLCKNNPETIKLKVAIARQFSKMKKALMEIKTRQENSEWIETRKTGKLSRRQETNTIDSFVEYATNQGSKSASKYFMNISKMENSALFILTSKFTNVRDVLDGQQLQTVAVCDQIVAKALRDGMKEGMFYKDIFQEAKKEVLKFVELIGASTVPVKKLIKGE